MTGMAMENHGDLIASDRVEGTAVYNRAGERLGHISNFMVDKRSGQVRYAVLSFGGFLGMGHDHYPLPWSMLSYDIDQGGYVVDLAKEVLDDAPRHEPDERPDYDETYGRSVFQYYGLVYPW
ncbi:MULTISPECIES: PRC-barrel domain-containing protein [Sphingobium]|uniref:Photosystem reaction center subunit H n=1 Tax=Sphingobium chungbukense TaxID=56193 RepID=A0A0M3AHS4_9SPHN|nr:MULTISPECIES: PRC-barrel domain-containing protein [Sphingobium]KKW89385.1 photosystem reaction center subunit H [Sphingobium chungbukense]PJG47679.1 photosystem reaction center subunit H [Sphingobium sp. LB126]